VTGTAGLSFLRGTAPVMAAVMMTGWVVMGVALFLRDFIVAPGPDFVKEFLQTKSLFRPSKFRTAP
jgi:hypothetical protein